MVSNHLEIKMEIEEIVSNTNETCDKDARHEVMHGERCYKKRHRARNGKCTAHCNQDEIHITMMNSAARALEYVLSGYEIVNRDRHHECQGRRDQVGNRQEFRHDPQEHKIERER